MVKEQKSIILMLFGLMILLIIVYSILLKEDSDLQDRYDALLKEADGYTLLELKGTNSILTDSGSSIKKDYLYDLAFQLYVYNLG